MRRSRIIPLLLVGALASPAGADVLFGTRIRPPPPVTEEEVRTTILFPSDAWSLSQDAKAGLDKVVVWLNSHPDHGALLAGHADHPATDEYNLALGDKRANVAKAYMVAGGIQASRLRTVSYGRSRPLVMDGVNWNDRVEIRMERR